jgi:hypothetical protein
VITPGAGAALTISRGWPLRFLDALKNTLSIPDKILLFNTHVDSNVFDPAIEEDLAAFSHRHGLRVHVRINEYAPLAELGRLFTEGRPNILLRLTVGLLSWLGYCLNIGRLFGGDFYSPWTHTVHLSSNHPAIALHEMGHAVDFSRRSWPGLYALSRYIPGVALYQEYVASVYAIEFLHDERRHDDEVRAYRLLIPAYSTYVLGAIIELFPTSVTRTLLFYVIGGGHALAVHYAGQRMDALRAAGEADITWAQQLARDGQDVATMFSMQTVRGREQIGTAVGLVVGAATCGVLMPLTAWLGFRWGRTAPLP